MIQVHKTTVGAMLDWAYELLETTPLACAQPRFIQRRFVRDLSRRVRGDFNDAVSLNIVETQPHVCRCRVSLCLRSRQTQSH